MKIGELKKSLSRCPPDVDDMEVILICQENGGKETMDCLAGVGMITTGESTALTLVSDTALRERAKNGKVFMPDGSAPNIPPPPDMSGQGQTFEPPKGFDPDDPDNELPGKP